VGFKLLRYLSRKSAMVQCSSTVPRWPHYNPGERCSLCIQCSSLPSHLNFHHQASLNIKAAIAQCPYAGVAPRPTLNYNFIKTLVFALVDVVKQSVGLQPLYIPAAAPPGTVGGLTAPGSEEGLAGICDKRESVTTLIVNCLSVSDTFTGIGRIKRVSTHERCLSVFLTCLSRSPPPPYCNS
jgi:hypothetical protein